MDIEAKQASPLVSGWRHHQNCYNPWASSHGQDECGQAMATIAEWLSDLGLERYREIFAAEEIDMTTLRHVTEKDLVALGITLGPRKKIMAAIALLKPDETTDIVEADSVEANAPVVSRDAERRQITVLFCDMVGSTALSERLDPEDLRDVLARYQDTCAEAIAKFDGHIAQTLGDGLMVYFGWPQAHEDDATRAVRAGLAITDEVSALTVGDTALQVRVGIHTGLAVVGEVAVSDTRGGGAVVGETPNIAARVQTAAAPGEVWITSATLRLLGSNFDVQSKGPQELKGIADPVDMYWIVGPSSAPSAFDARIEVHHTPLVGREAELAILSERWQMAKEGDGQVVLLCGEPGIGKSRITEELGQLLRDEPFTRLRYQSSPYHTNSALYPVIDQLTRASEFRKDDDIDTLLDKLEGCIVETGEPHTKALLASLLGFPTDRYPPLDLSPQKQKQLTQQALADQVVGLSRNFPVLLLLEDAHWTDPSSLETMDLVVDAITDKRVLAVVTFRPEFKPKWMDRDHTTFLTLNRLSRRQGADIATGVIGGRPLPGQVMTQIVLKTDGIPLFVEELTKATIESGFLKQARDGKWLDAPLPPLAIPSTLHDSLMARLDHLSPVKDVAQLAACIGRDFSYSLLAAVSPRSESSLQDALEVLVNSGLIFSKGKPPDATYVFKHALVRDTAYDSLLKRRRQTFHGQIAEALERLDPDLVAERPEVLAHHFEGAGNLQRAAPLYLDAARRDFARSLNNEALKHAQLGMDATSGMIEGKDRKLLQANLFTVLGFTQVAVQGYASMDAAQAFDSAEILCRDIDENELIFPVLWGIAVFKWVSGNVSGGVTQFDAMVTIAETTGNRDQAMVATGMLGVVLVNAGQFARARTLLTEALDMYDPSQHSALIPVYGQDMATTFWSWLCWGEACHGRFQASKTAADHAIRMAESHRHPLSTALAYALAGLGAAIMGSMAVARDLADHCLDLCDKQLIPFWNSWAQCTKAVALRHEGQSEDAIKLFREALAAFNAIGGTGARPYVLVEMALTALDLDLNDEADDWLTEAASATASSGEAVWIPLVDFGRGEAARAKGEPAMAEAHFKAAIQAANAEDRKTWELRAAVALARLWREQGADEQAYDLLHPIYIAIETDIETVDLAAAKRLLSELKP